MFVEGFPTNLSMSKTSMHTRPRLETIDENRTYSIK